MYILTLVDFERIFKRIFVCMQTAKISLNELRLSYYCYNSVICAHGWF